MSPEDYIGSKPFGACALGIYQQLFQSLYNQEQSNLIANTMSDLPKKVGWIGLGIMGLPMIRNLLEKMEKETQFYIYDVVQKSMDDFVEEGQGRVHACSSSKEVADVSVTLPHRTTIGLPASQH